jgi:hypothetical protein
MCLIAKSIFIFYKSAFGIVNIDTMSNMQFPFWKS